MKTPIEEVLEMVNNRSSNNLKTSFTKEDYSYWLEKEQNHIQHQKKFMASEAFENLDIAIDLLKGTVEYEIVDDFKNKVLELELCFNNLNNTKEMIPKEKSIKLVKITFEKVANASNYKGVLNDGGKKFVLIEDLSKKIAIEFVDEIVKEFEKSDLAHATKYWRDVHSEINSL